MAVTISGSGQLAVKIAQVVKTDTFTTTSTSFVDVTGLSVTITPNSASNRILVICDVGIGNASSSGCTARLLRNGSAIYTGDAAGSRPLGLIENDSQFQISRTGGTFIDSPATTSAVTYKIQILNSVGFTSCVNRTGRDDNTASYDPRSASSITVMEISG
jgi:hypothetical protein